MNGIALDFGQNTNGIAPQMKQREEDACNKHNGVVVARQCALGRDNFSAGIFGGEGYIFRHKKLIRKWLWLI
jgi:hypothetical protein